MVASVTSGTSVNNAGGGALSFHVSLGERLRFIARAAVTRERAKKLEKDLRSRTIMTPFEGIPATSPSYREPLVPRRFIENSFLTPLVAVVAREQSG